MDKEVNKIYNEFWKEIVERNGKVNMAQVKRELFDYYNILEEVPKVYDHVTGGLISKPNTKAEAVISEADAHYERYYEEVYSNESDDDQPGSSGSDYYKNMPGIQMGH